LLLFPCGLQTIGDSFQAAVSRRDQFPDELAGGFLMVKTPTPASLPTSLDVAMPRPTPRLVNRFAECVQLSTLSESPCQTSLADPSGIFRKAANFLEKSWKAIKKRCNLPMLGRWP